MWVDSLSISNFRNISEIDLPIGKKSLLVIGENSQGKTSLIEAIYFISFLKSFRSSHREDVITIGKNSMFIMTGIGKKNDIFKYNLLFEKGKRIAVKGEGETVKNQEMFSIIKVVMFYPGFTDIISGLPEKRRSFIDSVISKCEPAYLPVLRKYRQSLHERNIILNQRDKSSFNELCEIWEDRLVKYGSVITEKRMNYIEKIGVHLSDKYSKIFGKDTDINVKYHGLCGTEGKKQMEEIQEIFKKELLNRRKSDTSYGFTSYGPHRDEISFMTRDKDLRYFASRGEQRALVFSLLEIEIDLIKEHTGEYPVFLVDDIFSEFDHKREKNFLLSTAGKEVQIIATATSLSDENKNLFKGSIVQITGGRCTFM